MSHFPLQEATRQRSILAACAVVALIPLYIMPTDFWDGEIVDFAFRRDDFTGLRLWFFESRWTLQYYLYEIIRAVCKGSGLSHRVLIPSVACVAVVGVAYEVQRLAGTMLGLGGRALRVAAIFALLFPAWHVLTSSVILIHVLCVWWALLGYRLSKSRSVVAAIAGVLIAAASLQLNSNFVFLIALAFSDYLSGRLLRRGEGPPIQRCIVWAMALTVAFLLLKGIFPPYGQYGGYNTLTLSSAVLENLGRYLATCLPLLGILIGLFLVALRVETLEKRDLLARIAILLCLFAAAVLPYLLVGKSAGPEDFDAWTHRQALLLVAFGSLTFATLAQVFEQHSRGSKIRSRLFGTVMALFAVSSGALLYLGYHYKVKQATYMGSLQAALEEMGAPRPGGVSFRISDFSHTDVRTFEFTSLLEKSFGRAAWLTSPRPLSPQALKKKSQSPYRMMWLYPDMTPDCVSKIQVVTDATGWTSRLAWLHLLGLVDPPLSMKASLVLIRCS